MSHPPIRLLAENNRQAFLKHLLALSPRDIRMRFGMTLGPQALENYVSNIDFKKDVVLGIVDDDLDLIGAAHLSLSEDAAELGVSVLPICRGQGLGMTLVAHAVRYTQAQHIRKFYMHCLSENKQMMRIAKKLSMTLLINEDEVDSWLSLPEITPETMQESVALIDYALKQHVSEVEPAVAKKNASST